MLTLYFTLNGSHMLTIGTKFSVLYGCWALALEIRLMDLAKSKQ